MKLRDKKKAFAAVTLGALVTFQAGAAQADSTAAEIRFLKARLKQLEEKVAHQDKQIRGVAKLPAMPPALLLWRFERAGEAKWGCTAGARSSSGGSGY